MATVINLHGKPFTIGFSDADDTRRKNFFAKGVGSLTPQERALLVSLGVDEMLENSLKPYLAEFFSTLQTCSGDPSLILSRDCETAYFVIWSAFFHNRKETERRLLANRKAHGTYTDEDLAQDTALIDQLKTKGVSKTTQNGIDRLFTLMFVDDETPVPGNVYSRLFTLMFVSEATEEDN